jgi:hypothetical protein
MDEFPKHQTGKILCGAFVKNQIIIDSSYGINLVLLGTQGCVKMKACQAL